ncbi:TonB-dependent receptor [Phenylobacterium sp.]|uniref:TonB-dependent receptor n=1 Tax=Phenylobacterium sp. TaxID=1871053 RepID=UPI0025F84FEB|nr:TonB-dependent receptor [Phenylobacterium sp.]MBX3485489.1 TonB-dependent receptor [Phenylobacterium sp.]MCW5759090.1 TonB-dependent receptor [Phenylobacterium sp.]
MARRTLFLSVAVVALCAPIAAEAQSAAEVVGVEEVVVTAQKRAEKLQDVPISVAAFSGETLEAAGVQDIRDLRRITPSLYLATSSNTSNTRIMMRGIGTSGNTAVEPSVATFVDGVYVPRIGSLLAGLNDIGSVEVLRGPQGTLFGRNASMGAVQIRTTAPGHELGGEVSATYGQYGVKRISAMGDVPITDTLRTRVSVLGYEGGGFGRNDLTGKRMGRNDGFSARVAIQWDITPDVTWTLRGDHQNLSGDGYNTITVVSKTVTPTTLANWQTRLDPDGAGPLMGVLPYTADTYSRRVRQSTEGDLKDYQTGVASDLSWDLAGGYQLKLISGYRDWKNVQYQASNGNIPLELQRRTTFADSQNHSEELQLLSPDTLLDGRLNFVAGLFYYEEAYDIGQNIDLTNEYCEVFIRNTGTAARLTQCRNNTRIGASYYVFTQDTESVAAYAQANFKLTEQLTVTGGIRYSEDDKTAKYRGITRNPAAAQAAEVTDMALKEDKVTYRLAGNFKPNDDVMLFASFSTGFKSGGFDSAPGTTAAVGAAARSFNAETVENWELGVKSELFQRRLVANATLFRSDINDLQFRSFDGLQFRTRNNGKARQQGVEWELTARPIPALQVGLAGTYLDSEYLDFRGAPGLPGFGGAQDLTGQRLPYSPKWQGTLSGQYTGELQNGWSWFARADLAFSSKLNLAASGDNNPDALQKGYQQLSARLAIRGPEQKWEAAVFGQNLTGETFCTGIFNQPNNAAFGLNNATTGATALRCTLNDPRQVGVELKARF